MGKRRADLLLVERGFFESRAKAQEAIAAGLVASGGIVLHKASEVFAEDAEIEARSPYPWVSRGGVKLAAALDAFHVDPAGKICLDIGASTGGFSQVLLSRDAAKVYAVDVGRGQLHKSLVGDPRLVARERQDARTLEATMFPHPPQIILCDVSFISLRLALSRALVLAASDARLIALIKPQFEAGRAQTKKGIVKDPRVHERVCAEIAEFLQEAGWRVLGAIPSPILGGHGNREFLIGAERVS